MNFIFFGTPDRAVIVLQELASAGLHPQAIVTGPDKAVGRKQILTQSEVADYADSNNIPVFKPANKTELLELESELKKYQPDFLIVVAYGYLIPTQILEIPKVAAINVHYSLLPKWRGASPVIQQILNGESPVGFTIMRLEARLDTGAIYYQQSFLLPEPLPTTGELAKSMSQQSGAILPQILNQITTGELSPQPQDNELATTCYKLSKSDGLIDLSNPNQKQLWQKIQAMQPWPKTFFITQKNNQDVRVVINEANYENDQLVITKVTPAGKNPMSWDNFTNWLGFDPRKTLNSKL